MSTTTTNLGLFKYDTSTDSNVAFSITKALNNNWDIIDAKCGSSNNLLDFKWSDHLLNDQSWLRADTFSWQNGTTYSLVYNELLSEYNNSASTTKTEGGITYKRTPKGYKIALATQETAILNKYNSDGIAWYYILDTTNKRFKLPRTKFGFEGLRTSVGDDIEAGLPNITGEAHNSNWSSGINGSKTGAFYGTEDVANSAEGQYNASSSRGIGLDASRSNPIYGKSDTVQPPATQMYLYFYVGAFTKSADAQTAGLKAELLNGKADVTTPSIQAPYIKNTYVNGTSGYRIWSDGYCEQWGHIGPTSSRTTITFPKKFADTNYNIYNTFIDASTTDPFGPKQIAILSKTVSDFKVERGYTNRGSSDWWACGYIDSRQY